MVTRCSLHKIACNFWKNVLYLYSWLSIETFHLSITFIAFKLLISFSAFFQKECRVISIHQWFLVVFLSFMPMTLNTQIKNAQKCVFKRTKKVSPITKTVKSFFIYPFQIFLYILFTYQFVLQIFHLAKISFREHAYNLTIDICQEVVFLIGWIIIRPIISFLFLVRIIFQKLSKLYKSDS